MNTKLHKFPVNATDLVQPADSFVIQNMKAIWRKHWEHYKSKCVCHNNWTSSSDRVPNPGKIFFLKLRAQGVREFNALEDKNGVSYYGVRRVARFGLWSETVVESQRSVGLMDQSWRKGSVLLYGRRGDRSQMSVGFTTAGGWSI